jgi:hypothetical protein
MPFTPADIDRIGTGLLNGTLPSSKWTHAAHSAAAFWLLQHLGLYSDTALSG